jgi:hypothetical protein
VINPHLRLLFWGQGVWVTGVALFPFALAFAVLDELHGTPGQLGLVLAAETLPLGCWSSSPGCGPTASTSAA